MIDIVGILGSLLLLMWLAYRGMSVIVLAPILAMLAVGIDGGLPVLPAYTQLFMKAMGGFITTYFPLFLLGAIFGRSMESCGAATAIAGGILSWLGPRQAIFATVIACALLTYGGVSLFVVVFAVHPVATAMFRAADIPRRLIPATIALGSFTFTMTALPGTLQIQNMIPTKYFGTTAYAAPLFGILGGMVMLVSGTGWLLFRARRARQNQEGYGKEEEEEGNRSRHRERRLLHGGAALLPIVCVIGANYLFSEHMIPNWRFDVGANSPVGPIAVTEMRGIWGMVIALSLAILLTVPLHLLQGTTTSGWLSSGAIDSLLPIFNTASEVGYGKTIAALSGFSLIRQGLLQIPGGPLISESIAVNVLAGITGSASGGLGIALESLGAIYLQRAHDAGIDPELLHRVASMSCGGLDTLPHNGAVITLLAICRLTHRESYADIGVVSVLVPLMATVMVIMLGMLMTA